VSEAPQTDGWIEVYAGNNRGCAIRSDGTVYCWIENDPVHGPTPSGEFIKLDMGLYMGLYHTCGIRPDGSLVCWGCTDHDVGQCDDPPVQ